MVENIFHFNENIFVNTWFLIFSFFSFLWIQESKYRYSEFWVLLFISRFLFHVNISDTRQIRRETGKKIDCYTDFSVLALLKIQQIYCRRNWLRWDGRSLIAHLITVLARAMEGKVSGHSCDVFISWVSIWSLIVWIGGNKTFCYLL